MLLRIIFTLLFLLLMVAALLTVGTMLKDLLLNGAHLLMVFA